MTLLRIAVRWMAALLLVSTCGCFSPAMSIAGRSAIEQQVTSEAIRAAVDELAVGSLQRVPYALRVSAPRDVDGEWVEACARQHLVHAGHSVLAFEGAPANPPHVVDIIVAHAASDLESTIIGIPLFVPGVPVAFGDISLYKSSTITGRAQIGAQVFDPSGRLIATVPELRRSRFFKNESYLTFIGSFIETNIDGFVEPGEEVPPPDPQGE